MKPEELDNITCEDIALFDHAAKNDWIDAMYERVNIDRNKLANALRDMGKPPFYNDWWSHTNPTFGYCAVVTVALYKMLREKGVKCKKMRIKGSYLISDEMQAIDHNFIILENGNVIIDLTAEQVDYCFPYHEAKAAHYVGNRPGRVRSSAETLSERMKH